MNRAGPERSSTAADADPRGRNRGLDAAVSSAHDKEADELNASVGDGATAPIVYEQEEEPILGEVHPGFPEEEEVAASAPIEHEKDPHEQPVIQTSQEEYEARFPPVPERPRAATTYSLFQDPNRFESDNIRSRTHYLTDSLQGTLWLDADGDGKRGSESDSTLNAMEYDHGVGGVTVALVKCDESDEIPLYNSVSMPNAGGQASSLKRSDVPEAGQYFFPLETVEPGRYYVMYKAPKNYRLSGNVLPLERASTEDGAYFDCIPRGGEGGSYVEEAKASGDLDWGGYCARSVGCLEVGKKFSLDEDYGDLKFLEGSGEEFEGTTRNLLALPDETMLNVGLAEEEWALATYQYADATVTLRFPSTVGEEDLKNGALPENFGRSQVKKALESTLALMVGRGGSSNFTVQGVELHGGEIIMPPSDALRDDAAGAGEDVAGEAADEAEDPAGEVTHEGEDSAGEGGSSPASRRGLRGLVEGERTQTDLIPRETQDVGATRDAQDGDGARDTQDGDVAQDLQDGDAEEVEGPMTEVKYTLTTRGTYRPPPFQQLGSVVQDSINSDPKTLVKSLKERRDLPPVFGEVESADARHLTLKLEAPPAPKPPRGPKKKVVFVTKSADEPDPLMDKWAIVPVILLAFGITGLVGMFLFRRVFVRRKKVRNVNQERLGTYLMGGTDRFAVADIDIDEEMNHKRDSYREEEDERRSKKKKKKRGNRVEEGGGNDGNNDPPGLRAEPTESSSDGGSRCSPGRGQPRRGTHLTNSLSTTGSQGRTNGDRSTGTNGSRRSRDTDDSSRSHGGSSVGHRSGNRNRSGSRSRAGNGNGGPSAVHRSGNRAHVAPASSSLRNSAPPDLEESLEEQRRRRERRRRKKKDAQRSADGRRDRNRRGEFNRANSMEY